MSQLPHKAIPMATTRSFELEKSRKGPSNSIQGILTFKLSNKVLPFQILLGPQLRPTSYVLRPLRSLRPLRPLCLVRLVCSLSEGRPQVLEGLSLLGRTLQAGWGVDQGRAWRLALAGLDSVPEALEARGAGQISEVGAMPLDPDARRRRFSSASLSFCERDRGMLR